MVAGTVCSVVRAAQESEAVHRCLSRFYRTLSFRDATAAYETLVEEKPRLVILDGDCEDAAAVLRALRNDVPDTPVIALQGPQGQLEGASLVLNKPVAFSSLLPAADHFMNRDAARFWQTLSEPARLSLEHTVAVFNGLADVIDAGRQLPLAEVKRSCEPLIQAIERGFARQVLEGARVHENATYVHSIRMAALLVLFGLARGMARDDIRALALGGLLADIGKMVIPHDVLNKSGQLSASEFAVMRAHVSHTMQLMEQTADVPDEALVIASQHHEKLDGTGYPAGLRADALSDIARMAAIVDIFTGLTDRRVYKPAMPAERALEVMHEMAGKLDQRLLRLFSQMLMDYGLLKADAPPARHGFPKLGRAPKRAAITLPRLG